MTIATTPIIAVSRQTITPANMEDENIIIVIAPMMNSRTNTANVVIEAAAAERAANIIITGLQAVANITVVAIRLTCSAHRQ